MLEISYCPETGNFNENTNKLEHHNTHVLPMFAVLAGVGMISNLFVFCILVFRKRLRRKNFNFFASCISFTDIICSVIVLILTLCTMLEYKYTHKLCFAIYTTAVVAFGSSISFALLISLDRLIAVSIHDCSIKHIFRGKRRYGAIALPPVFIGVITLVFIYSYPTTGCFFNCEITVMFSLQNGRIPVVMEAQLIVTLPVLFIAGLYSLIIVRLRRHIRNVSVQVMSDQTDLKTLARQSSLQATAIGNTNLQATAIGKTNMQSTAIRQKNLQTTTIGKPSMPATKIKAKCNNTFSASGNTIIPDRPIKTENRGHALVPDARQDSIEPGLYLHNEDSKDSVICVENVEARCRKRQKIFRISKNTNTKRVVGFQDSPKRHIDAIVTMTIVQLVLLISFVPNSIMEIIILFTNISNAVQPFTRLLVSLHPVINPIVYILRMPEIRAEIKRMYYGQ